ncbi:hypothetical protein A5886_001797 [Enterococcus sp. 8G7_MSG3316]|uniref:Pectinesterase n=1 Tax=Candidatus Enterococcus testudinis TaxID=1834191 RepID=A0A242A6Q6_9ENTE|nr:hypothetical protein [Enterococcus sp. 8G7_MSG3316]OTN76718.1 hypothetical protein A5886_001797 [Enterococcus sp. 8G7_MSG3316]
MGLIKLIQNRISSEWKNTFNQNVDIANREINRLDQRDTYTNNRIDNLVLSSDENTQNEVIDGRVDWRGVRFATLQARLTSSEELTAAERLEISREIESLRQETEQLNNTIQNLYGGSGGVESIYVSTNGSDSTGLGTEARPYRSIQTAVNSLPLLSTTHFIIYVEPGAYLEDVVINGLKSARFEIVSTNNASVDATTGTLSCFVRSIEFIDCDMYCRVRGIQSTDVVNGPDFFIRFSRVAYGAVENCRTTASTLDNTTYYTYLFNSCIGNIYTCWASNQRVVLRAEFAATARFSGDLVGNNNNTLCSARGSIIYRDTAAPITGTTTEHRSLGGQIFS